MGLCVLYNMSELSRPGLGYAWRYGLPEESDAEFDLSDSSA